MIIICYKNIKLYNKIMFKIINNWIFVNILEIIMFYIIILKNMMNNNLKIFNNNNNNIKYMKILIMLKKKLICIFECFYHY